MNWDSNTRLLEYKDRTFITMQMDMTDKYIHIIPGSTIERTQIGCWFPRECYKKLENVILLPIASTTITKITRLPWWATRSSDDLKLRDQRREFQRKLREDLCFMARRIYRKLKLKISNWV